MKFNSSRMITTPMLLKAAMTAAIAITLFPGDVFAAKNRKEPAEKDPLIQKVYDLMTPAAREDYMAARVRVPDDAGMSVKTWLAQNRYLEDRAKHILQIDLAEALVEKFSDDLDRSIKFRASNGASVSRKKYGKNLEPMRRSLRDAETILDLIVRSNQVDTDVQSLAVKRLLKVREMKQQLE